MKGLGKWLLLGALALYATSGANSTSSTDPSLGSGNGSFNSPGYVPGPNVSRNNTVIPTVSTKSSNFSGPTQTEHVATLQNKEGIATHLETNYGGSPLDVLVHTVGGGSYISSRAPANQTEANAAAIANASNLLSRGLITQDQYQQAVDSHSG